MSFALINIMITISTQNRLGAAAALLLAIFIAVGFTACSNEDNSVDIFTPEKVNRIKYDQWLTNKGGTLMSSALII